MNWLTYWQISNQAVTGSIIGSARKECDWLAFLKAKGSIRSMLNHHLLAFCFILAHRSFVKIGIFKIRITVKMSGKILIDQFPYPSNHIKANHIVAQGSNSLIM
jgi:hypothetical protein